MMPSPLPHPPHPPATTTHARSKDCRPPPGQVYLTMGQDLFALQDYLEHQYNASLHEYMQKQQQQQQQQTEYASSSSSSLPPPPPPPPRRSDSWPAAFMVYTDLATLAGLTTPTDYGSGVEYANGLAELVNPGMLPQSSSGRYEYSTNTKMGLQMGLWLSGSDGCRAVVNGTWTTQVRQLVHYLGHEAAPFPRVFVRVGYEFDNPSFGYVNDDPSWYRRAFCIIVHACRSDQACHRRTLFVWHSWAAGVPYGYTLQDFYPGDEYVDWIGISVFQQFFHHNNNNNNNNNNNSNGDETEMSSIWSGGNWATLQAVLDFNRQLPSGPKPVVIAESTPFGGIDQNVVNAWETWFTPLLSLLFNNDDDDNNNNDNHIAMWSYIDCNWEELPIWHKVGFGDTRIIRNETIATLWRRHVTSRLLGYGSLDLYCSAEDDYDHVISTTYPPPPESRDNGWSTKNRQDAMIHPDGPNEPNYYQWPIQKIQGPRTTTLLASSFMALVLVAMVASFTWRMLRGVPNDGVTTRRRRRRHRPRNNNQDNNACNDKNHHHLDDETTAFGKRSPTCRSNVVQSYQSVPNEASTQAR